MFQSASKKLGLDQAVLCQGKAGSSSSGMTAVGLSSDSLVKVSYAATFTKGVYTVYTVLAMTHMVLLFTACTHVVCVPLEPLFYMKRQCTALHKLSRVFASCHLQGCH
jgi:hypothetical protein